MGNNKNAKTLLYTLLDAISIIDKLKNILIQEQSDILSNQLNDKIKNAEITAILLFIEKYIQFSKNNHAELTELLRQFETEAIDENQLQQNAFAIFYRQLQFPRQYPIKKRTISKENMN